MATAADGDPPLLTLVSWAWIAFALEVDNRVEAAGRARAGRAFRISLATWTNGLRLIDEDGISRAELEQAARARTNLGGLERWGWIQVGPDQPGRRPGFGTARGLGPSTRLRPTRAGRYARRLWPEAVAEVHQRWRTRFGAGPVDQLVGRLTHRASEAMPWSPPEIRPPGGFRTEVVAGDPQPLGPSGELALPAGLGQVLTAATVAAEQGRKLAVALGANLLRPLAAGPVPRRLLPARSGVSKEAVAMSLTWLVRAELVQADGGEVVLTARGRRALGAQQRRVGTVGDPELRTALAAVLDQREALAAGLEPPEGGWRGERPYRAQTDRLLADPTGALPWHPMVLHRGGFPDGS